MREVYERRAIPAAWPRPSGLSALDIDPREKLALHHFEGPTRFTLSECLADAKHRAESRVEQRDDGFDVEVARDGATAIARLACGPLPDTLITELRIPLADGTAVARRCASVSAVGIARSGRKTPWRVFFSVRGYWSEYRRPRFKVRLLVTLKSS